jgi:Domain of unknown function (DUF4157)
VVQSPGRPLDNRVRGGMEQQFGSDFSRVRVHDDGPAAASAEAVGANAYTVGSDIVFNSGRYAPATPRGDELLRHELSHVVQQRDAVAQGSSPIEIGQPGDAYEREADAMTAGGSKSPSHVSQWTSEARLQGWWLPDFFVNVLGFFPHLFGSEWFTHDQLQEYLDGLKTRKTIEDGIFSDNKARALVSRESEFGPYTTDIKILLVHEMDTGHVSGFDEGAINTLLRRQPVAERQKIVSAIGRDKLWSTFSGGNRRVLEALTMTAADATDALVGRLRTLDSDALEDYRTNATDPAVQQAIQRAITLSQITAAVPNSALLGQGPAGLQLPGGPVPAMAATFQINGVPVFAFPDVIDASLGGVAFTDIALMPRVPMLAPAEPGETTEPTVGEFDPPEIRLVIRTRYPSQEGPTKGSSYGVGTRPGDEPTTRFHERAHSQAWFDFIKQNPPPAFTGRRGMTRTEFNAAVAAWTKAAGDWHTRATNYSIQMTDCVGTLPSAADLQQLQAAGFSATICSQGSGH